MNEKKHLYWLVLILGLGISLSVASFFSLSLVHSKKIASDVKAMAQEHVGAIEKEMIASLQFVQSIVSFQSVSVNVDRDEFKQFTRHPLEESPSIHAVQWISRVSLRARTAYEESMKQEGFAGFMIKRPGKDGGLVPASRRDEYYPVHYVEPFSENRNYLGLDQGSFADRFEIMAAARDEGSMKITPPVLLSEINIPESKSGFVAFYPIYQNGVAINTVGARQQYLVGFITGVFRYETLIANALAQVSAEGFDFSLFDVDSVQGPVYQFQESSTEINLPFWMKNAAKKREAFHYESTFTVAGRQWELVGQPTVGFILARQNMATVLVPFFLLFLTGASALYFMILNRQTMKLQGANKALDRANARLKEMVTTDSLTGLLNRRGLHQFLFHGALHVWRSSGASHVLMIDLDNFKTINDDLGFVVGDLALKETAKTILSAVRSSDIVCRLGGDEFVVILPHSREAEALVVAQKIRFQIAQMNIGLSGGKNVFVTASIGAIPLTGEENNLDEVIEKAHHALQKGKHLGKNQVALANQGKDVASEQDIQFGEALRAMRNGAGFYSVLQRINRLEDNRAVGFEMLTRLNHKDYELPIDFFQIALEAKLLTVVDRACLKTCLEAAHKLPEDMPIHLNMFPSTLMETPPAQLIELFKNNNGTHPICIEISEQQIVGNPDAIAKPIRALREAGIQISMDDVGFGSSCLESLIVLEPEIVKIDKKCVQGIAQDPGKVRSLKRLLQVVKSCGATAYVEGIECVEELDVVIELGVEYGQGYYFGKPSVEPMLN